MTSSYDSLEKKITWGILMFPKLIHELPEIIHLLDQGESVNIEKISDTTLRSYLQDLLKELFDLNNTASRSSASTSSSTPKVTDYLQSIFQNSFVSKKVSAMNSGETLAFRSGIPRLLHVLELFPELRSELPLFFDGLLGEGSVDSSGLSNTDVREELGSLLKSLGLQLDDDDDDDDECEVYSFPADTNKREAIESCLQLMNRVFEVASKYRPLTHDSSSTVNINEKEDEHKRSKKVKKDKKEKKEKKHKKEKSKKSHKKPRLEDDHCSSDDTSDAEDNNIEVDQNTEIMVERKIRVIGPAAPPPNGVASSSATAAISSTLVLDDDEDEDSLGPAPATIDHSSSRHDAVSAYSRLLKTDGNTGTAGSFVGDTVDARWVAAQQYEEHVSDVPAEREEWMTEIGENKVLTGMGAFGTTRKFQAGKLAKKAAQQYSDMKARQEAFSGTEGHKVSDEIDKMRGPSLMEAHLKHREDKKVESQIKARNAGESTRRPFDREKDVLTSRKMNDRQVTDLMEHAKELGSRFDRGSFQRSV